MVEQKQNNNTPIRNRKVGLPDPQGNNGQATVATTGPSKMVQDMAVQNFALKNGGQMPPAMNGSPSGIIPPVATVNPNLGMNFFGGGNNAMGKYEAVNVNAQQNGTVQNSGENAMTGSPDGKMQPVGYVNQADYTPNTPAPAPEYGTNGVQFTNPVQPQQNDLSSLSAALNGSDGAAAQPQQPQFEADPSQKDGGFANWIKKLIPKKRPGKREGETDDEYDARRTRNMQMMATLADTIRHMGNIINTAKGAPLQQFNDPNTMLEQGRQARKAERQKKAALDADAAYKASSLSIKEAAQKAAENYKLMLLGYKDAADKRAAQAAADNKKYKDDYFTWQKENAEKNRERQAANDKQKQQNWEKQFNETKRHHAVSESNSRKGGGRSGKGGSGSGGKYWFEDKNGKMHYQPNKTMWEQEYYREYGKLPQGETSTSTSTKVLNKDGSEKTVTTRSKGNSMTAQAAASQNAAKAARNKGKSGGSGKGHNALNAWFKKNNK